MYCTVFLCVHRKPKVSNKIRKISKKCKQKLLIIQVEMASSETLGHQKCLDMFRGVETPLGISEYF